MLIISNLSDTNPILKKSVDDALTFYKLPLTCASNNCAIPEEQFIGVVKQSLINAENTLKAQVITTKPVVISPVVISPVITALETQKVTYIGNPGKSQYQGTDYKSNLARCIWDMQNHKSRIYIGYGDSWNNQGPVQIWSIATGETEFRKEIVIQEESCWLFREYDNKLYIPGTDACGETQGTIYTKNDIWKNIPIYATHIIDVCHFNGMLYATLSRGQSQLLMKADGTTWKALFEFTDFASGMLGNCLPFDDCVIFTTLEGWDSNIYKCSKDDKVTKLYTYKSRPQKPEMWRSEKYKTGYLCCFSYPLRLQYMPYPLYFMDLNGVNQVGFENDNVRDIVVRGNDVYILTAEYKNNTFYGYIYYSSDLKSWSLLTSFNLTSMPTSLELLDKIFYVGTTIKNDLDTVTETDSGNIYRIQLSQKSPTPIGIIQL